ncbi:MAG: SDR family oxidoreductase [Chloroflexi bacterium]|nr:SDR family oxidoreductase [Chloroflexota bacterium]
MKLHGRAAIVTGANRGLGQAIAADFVREGAHVVLAARDAEALRGVASELAAKRPMPEQQVLAEPTDVSRAEEVERLVGRTVDALGRLDILVCNAGVYGPTGAIEVVDWGEWVRAVEINLFGTVLCCRAVLPIMQRQGSGKIVTLSGGGATAPLPRISAYAASKAAVVRFTETLAKEVENTGIDVNAVAPGALNTRLLDEILEAGPEQVGAAFYERALRQKTEGGTPLDVGAELVTFLASSESDGISGRLISAVWDDWRDLPKQRERLAPSDVYTLRRIVPSDRGWSDG